MPRLKTPEELLLESIGSNSLPISIPDNSVPAPVAPVDYAYNKNAEKDMVQAADLEKRAEMPMAKPQGLKETFIAAARALMEGMAHPQDPYGQQNRREDLFKNDQAQLIARAKGLRSDAAQQQQMGETALLRKVQQDRETREASEPIVTNMGGGVIAQTPKMGGASKFENAPNFPAKTGSEETNDIKEYKFAQGQGYKGNFEQWQKDMANLKNSSDTMSIIQGNSPNGPIFYRVPKNGPAGPVTVDGSVVHSKPAEAPMQLKNQANAAAITKRMIDVVKDVAARNPNLVGPIAGRVTETLLKAGGDPTGLIQSALSMPEGQEKDAALLSGHLAYLFLNEARAALPGRPIQAQMEWIKEHSATMAQNPRIMAGFLEAAENNANFALDQAKNMGYDALAGSQNTTPANQQGRIRVKNKATGQTGTISASAFDPAKYEKI